MSTRLLPSVVSIVSVNGQQVDEGSGVVITPTGRILTNDHVIAGSSQITVQFNDGTTAPATVVGGDATDDIAVIQAKGVSGLTAATLGSSASLAVGQQVVAIGSPLGLSGTVTDGIVSALNRPVRTSAATQPQSQGGGTQDPFGQLDPNGTQSPNGTGSPGQSSTTGSDGTVLNAIQTDAAINHGNSGGPLVDMDGKVIGINSAIASSSSGGSSADQSGSIGVGFAIPIDQAKRIANEIIAKGYATHAVLGATVRDDQASQLGLSSGATIASVTAGGAAAKAGLKAKDVVTKVGSIRVDSSDALIAAVRSQAPGGSVQITYRRDSQAHTVPVTLGSAKSS
ncbi:MAG: trypsin-like peptidase domain-containing protein [Actinomycetota bacterium]|nr:trypsin-like peptidase domain-containing protein [Actinomycetota bacterium]